MSDEPSVDGETGNEAVTTATNETPIVTAVIDDQRKRVNSNAEVAHALREVKRALQSNYPDPDRITVPVSAGAVIHQDFRRKVLIPDHIMFPHPALDKDKQPILAGTVRIPPVVDRDGKLVRGEKKLPIYVAADVDGSPMRDSKGNLVVIDPQTGSIRQRVRVNPPTRKKSWLRTQWDRIVAWFKRA